MYYFSNLDIEAVELSGRNTISEILFIWSLNQTNMVELDQDIANYSDPTIILNNSNLISQKVLMKADYLSLVNNSTLTTEYQFCVNKPLNISIFNNISHFS